MDNENVKLSELLFITEQSEVISEIKTIVKPLAQDFDYDFFEQFYADIIRLFQGQYPGYRQRNDRR